eukprot:m.61335 g.61335  ORF g.61335 m.61335 type:complete len:393 (-) comp11400_c0_seq1:29-1207(-)
MLIVLFTILFCSVTTTSQAQTLPVVEEEVVFQYGDKDFYCVRQPTLVRVGKRMLAMTELWNYTGNNCYPNSGPPPLQNDTVGFQKFGFRYSDNYGKNWSEIEILPLSFQAWNAQVVYNDDLGIVVMHIKEKLEGTIYQMTSKDAITWSTPVDITAFFPVSLRGSNGIRPSYGMGIVVPSSYNPAGRIIMTAYDHLREPSCWIYTSDDNGTTWQIASQLQPGFECQAASVGGHSVYLNARHRAMHTPNRTIAPVRRVEAFSLHDGFEMNSTNTSLASTFDPDDEGVFGSTVSLTSKSGNPILFFAIAKGPPPFPNKPLSQINNGRQNLVLHYSTNGGSTWTPLNTWSGYAGYVTLTPIPETGHLGILYEVTLSGCQAACGMKYILVNISSLLR